jgi:hypothetical protein
MRVLILAVVVLAVAAPVASAEPSLRSLLGLPSHVPWPDCTGGLLCGLWPMVCTAAGLSCPVA